MLYLGVYLCTACVLAACGEQRWASDVLELNLGCELPRGFQGQQPLLLTMEASLQPHGHILYCFTHTFLPLAGVVRALFCGGRAGLRLGNRLEVQKLRRMTLGAVGAEAGRIWRW